MPRLRTRPRLLLATDAAQPTASAITRHTPSAASPFAIAIAPAATVARTASAALAVPTSAAAASAACAARTLASRRGLR